MINSKHPLSQKTLSAISPYFTNIDPALARNSGGRDPLGLQPVWSALGRKIVPALASPVRNINGIKAVLLILWLSRQDKVAQLLPNDESSRRFFRLMEGIAEYWLASNNKRPVFGSNSLKAAGQKFALHAGSSKTVANGLYLYYRGSIRRAGLADDDWYVASDVDEAFQKTWGSSLTDILIEALLPCLPKGSRLEVVPYQLLQNQDMSAALEKIFSADFFKNRLGEYLLADQPYINLARDFLALKDQADTKKWSFDEILQALIEQTSLSDEVQDVRRCEPFLLVLQNFFDVLRAAAGKTLGQVATEINEAFVPMCERAEAFLSLRHALNSPRMQQLQKLAETLAEGRSATDPLSQQHIMVLFAKELVAYHSARMKERGRDALVLIEDGSIVLPVSGDVDAKLARQNLIDGSNWINDYYLNTAASMYAQTFQ